MNRIAAASGTFNAFGSVSCMLIVKHIWACHMEFTLYKLNIIIIIITELNCHRNIIWNELCFPHSVRSRSVLFTLHVIMRPQPADIWIDRRLRGIQSLDGMMNFEAITVPCRGQGVIIQISEGKKRQRHTSDNKWRQNVLLYNQVKSTLFHFLTEFKHIGPFLKSRSFRPFWLLADILAVSVSWPQIRGTALPFIGLSDRFDCWPTFWLFRLVGHKLGAQPCLL